MAYTTESSYTGDGSTKDFLITFPFLESTDIKARVNAVDTSAFSVTGTTVTFNTAPPNTQAVLLYRDTNIDKTKVVFQAGSSIRAQDLNSLGNQVIYGLQEEAQNTGGATFALGDKGHIAVNTANSWVINNNIISNAMMLDNSVDSAEIVNGAIDLNHMSSDSVDEDNLQISNAGSNGQFLQKQSGNTGGLTWATPTQYTHPNHSGEVTSTADGATVIASNIVDEDNLKISNAGSNGQFLSKQSGNTGGLTWAAANNSPLLKFAHASTSTEKDFSATTWEDSGLSISYTPASSSSILVLEARPILRLRPNSHNHGHAEVRFELDDAGSALDGMTYGIFAGNSHNNTYGYDFSQFSIPILFTHIYSNSNTNAKTFKLQCYENTNAILTINSHTSNIGNSTAKSYFTITEYST